MKKISAIVNGNKFNNKNKIGKFKYNDIKDLVNNINNNGNNNNETLAKQHLNALNKIKKERKKKINASLMVKKSY